jgi:hypothetical protein
VNVHLKFGRRLWLPRGRLRLSVRGLAIAIAVVGLLLAADMTRRRCTCYRKMASYHAMLQRGCLESAVRAERAGILSVGCMEYFETDASKTLAAAKLLREYAAYEGALKTKYEFAASRPWLTVEPDEPFASGEDLRWRIERTHSSKPRSDQALVLHLGSGGGSGVLYGHACSARQSPEAFDSGHFPTRDAYVAR